MSEIIVGRTLTSSNLQAIFTEEHLQNQNVTQEAADLPFHDNGKIGIAGSDCAGGDFPPPQCLSPLKHISSNLAS
jgi:hypothetical protein